MLGRMAKQKERRSDFDCFIGVTRNGEGYTGTWDQSLTHCPLQSHSIFWRQYALLRTPADGICRALATLLASNSALPVYRKCTKRRVGSHFVHWAAVLYCCLETRSGPDLVAFIPVERRKKGRRIRNRFFWFRHDDSHRGWMPGVATIPRTFAAVSTP